MLPLIRMIGGMAAKKAIPKMATKKVLSKTGVKLSDNKKIIKKHIESKNSYDNSSGNPDNPSTSNETPPIPAQKSSMGKALDVKNSLLKNNKLKSLISSPEKKDDKSILSKLSKIIAVTKENLAVNKMSLMVQKHTDEWNKERAYKAAHALKEKTKGLAKNGISKVKGAASTVVQKTKDVAESQGGFLKTLGKILAAGYLIKKLWPTISRLAPRFLNEYIKPFLKDTLWPMIKENWKELLAGAGILSFLANPLGFMITATKAAFKVGGSLFKVFTKLIKGIFSLGSPLLKNIKDKVIDVAKTGINKAKDLVISAKDKVKGLAKTGIDKAKDLGKKGLKKAGGVVSKVAGGAGKGLKKLAFKGLGGLIKLMKPLAKLIPFVGPVIMSLDLIDTLFPNLKYTIMEMFSPKKIVEFATSIWGKVEGLVTSVREWVSEKLSGFIGLIRGGLASIISNTYGKIPILGKYANQFADFIRGKSTDLDKEAKYSASSKDKQSGEFAQNRLEQKGAIESKWGDDAIKDWGAIEKLPANTIKGLIASGNFSDEDIARMKSIIDKKIAKSEKAKKAAGEEESKPQSQKDKEQQQKDRAALVNVTKSIQNFENLIKKGKEKGFDTSAYSKSLAIQKTKQKALRDKLVTKENIEEHQKSYADNEIYQPSYTMEDKNGKKVKISKKDNNRLKYAKASLATADTLEEDKHEAKLENLKKEILEGIQNKEVKVAEPGKASKQPVADKLGLAQYGTGGFTGKGNDGELAGVVHKNEFVLTSDDLKELDASPEGKNKTIKKISSKSGENIEEGLQTLKERRKEDSKKTNKSFTINNKTVENVTKAQARDIEKLSTETTESIKGDDWEKTDALDKKMEKLLDSINDGTYINPDNKVAQKKPSSQSDFVPNKEQYNKDKHETVKIFKSIQQFDYLIKKGKEQGLDVSGYEKAKDAQQKKLQKFKNKTINYETNLKKSNEQKTRLNNQEKSSSITKPSGETNTLKPIKVKASLPNKQENTELKVPKKLEDIKETDVFKGKKLKNMNKDVVSNLKGLGYEYKEKFGEKIQLNSTGRSVKEQTKLYNEMLKRNGGVSDGSVATPGGSMHNYGLAVDAQSNQLQKAEDSGLMEKYGFHRPVHKANGALETWHMETMGIDRNAVRLLGKKAIKEGKDVDALSKEGAFTKGNIKPLDADGRLLGTAEKEAKIVKKTRDKMSSVEPGKATDEKSNIESKWDLKTAAGKAAFEKEQSGHKLTLAEDMEASSISGIQGLLGDLGLGENRIAGMGEAAQIFNKKSPKFLENKQKSANKTNKTNKVNKVNKVTASKKPSENEISLFKLEKKFPVLPKNTKLIKSELGWDLKTAAGLAGFKEEQQKATTQGLDITTEKGIKDWKKLTAENKDLGMSTFDTLEKQSIQTVQGLLGDLGLGENRIAGMGEASQASNGFKNIFIPSINKPANKTDFKYSQSKKSLFKQPAKEIKQIKDLMPNSKSFLNNTYASNLELKSNPNSGESIKSNNIQATQKREKNLEIDNKAKKMAKQTSPSLKAPEPVVVEHTNTVIHKESKEAPKITLNDAEMETGSFILMGNVI